MARPAVRSHSFAGGCAAAFPRLYAAAPTRAREFQHDGPGAAARRSCTGLFDHDDGTLACRVAHGATAAARGRLVDGRDALAPRTGGVESARCLVVVVGEERQGQNTLSRDISSFTLFRVYICLSIMANMAAKLLEATGPVGSKKKAKKKE